MYTFKCDAVFGTMIERVLSNEGGFQADPKDRGNWTSGTIGKGVLKGTKYGISAMSYPDIDIKNLTVDDARQIYYDDWWLKLRLDRMRPVFAFQLLDFALHSGAHNAQRCLQRALGVKDDGVIGPVTIAKLDSSDFNDVTLLFVAERLEFLTNTKPWETYHKGFARRIAHNLRYAAQDN